MVVEWVVGRAQAVCGSGCGRRRRSGVCVGEVGWVVWVGAFGASAAGASLVFGFRVQVVMVSGVAGWSVGRARWIEWLFLLFWLGGWVGGWVWRRRRQRRLGGGGRWVVW